MPPAAAGLQHQNRRNAAADPLLWRYSVV